MQNIWYVTPVKGSFDPQVENCCSSEIIYSLTPKSPVMLFPSEKTRNLWERPPSKMFNIRPSFFTGQVPWSIQVWEAEGIQGMPGLEI